MGQASLATAGSSASAPVPRSSAIAFRSPDDVANPVLRVILERARAGSTPGARTDDFLVSLAIEGGGLRGAVSAGMCVVLEAAGLTRAFDRVYGVSAGALNAAAMVAGQAALSATYYEDAATRRVINHARALLGRPVVDFDLLFDDIIATRKPLTFDNFASGPDLRLLAMALDQRVLRVLRDFADIAEVLAAVRASAALPRVSGLPPVFRGERMADGGLLEAIPAATALKEGATHVLVLRSRPAGYRAPRYAGVADDLAVRGDRVLAEVVRRHRDAYNRQAAELAALSERPGDATVLQLAVPAGTALVGRLEADRRRVVDALRAGAAVAADAFLRRPVELRWQPVIHPGRAIEPAARPRRSSPRPLRRSATVPEESGA